MTALPWASTTRCRRAGSNDDNSLRAWRRTASRPPQTGDVSARGAEPRCASRSLIGLLASCERSATQDDLWTVNVYLAIAYAQHGDTQRAFAARERVLLRKPEFSIDWLRRMTGQYSDNPSIGSSGTSTWPPVCERPDFREF